MSDFATATLKCFCLDDDIEDPYDVYKLRCGCSSVHYHCIIQYIQVKLGDRKGEVNDGTIICPFGTTCASLSHEGAGAVHITLQDLDDLVNYSNIYPHLISLIPCRPLTSDIVESYRSWLLTIPDNNDENSTILPEEKDPYLEATSKNCPGCNFASVHYHLHGCHHLVCPRCNTNYCASCLKSGDENIRERGYPSTCACPSRYWSTFCCNLRTREDISDYLEIRPVPHDVRCGCIVCPDCAFQKPCDSCSGYCAVCTGDLPQSIKELGAPYDVSVTAATDLPSRYRRAVRLNNCDKLRAVLEEAKNELSEHDFMKLLHNKSKRGITALHDACRFNCFEAVKVLLGFQVFNVMTTDNKNNSALHVAFESDDFHGSILPLIETIVAANSNILLIQNNDGDFPLHIAACSGRLEHIQYLLNSRPEFVNAVNNDGDTAMHKVAHVSWQWNDPDDKLRENIVKTFLNFNCDLGIKNKKGRTPLDADYTDTMPLGHGSKYGNFISEYLSKTIKHVVRNNYEELKVQLDNCPALGRVALDSDKNTALHIAAFNENLDTIQLLCKPETINLKNSRGETPLFIAALSNHMATVKYLIQNKANTFMKDIKGRTYLNLLTKEERKEINEFLKETRSKN